MTPAKLHVFFAFYPYGGNGASSSEHPNIRSWFAATVTACNADPRISHITARDFSDTPIPMMRNRSVLEAREVGADVIVMIDSDQHPDLYNGVEATAKPFFESSFDFLYKRRMEGKATCIGAPYCGPPPGECPYVFRWDDNETNNPNVDHHIEMYDRATASQMQGIHPCAALPTGCIMFDMELFNVTDPKHEYAALLAKYQDPEIAKLLTKPWFYYEYEDIYAGKKASTEDVTATRDMVLCALAKLGYNVMFANWDAWAGHWKPKCVGKPVLLSSDSINQKYMEAVLSGRQKYRQIMNIGQQNANVGHIVDASPPKRIVAINDTIVEAVEA